MEIALLLALPLLGAALLSVLGARRHAGLLNVAISFFTLCAAVWLAVRLYQAGELKYLDEQFFVDPFNGFLVLLTALVNFSTALFSSRHMPIEQLHRRLRSRRLRLYHAFYQLFMFTMLLALLSNNMGILWVAMEAATLSTVLLISLYRSPASLEAAWKYFILCGVGIAQALFGTILLYFAAERVLGDAGGAALLWTRLDAVKTQLEPTVMAIAFMFLLVGYGTKVGLVPLHNWLPDAYAESPTVLAVLSGLLLNVALYAVIRCKILVEGALHSPMPGRLLMLFGIASLLLGAFMLLRQKDVKRLFAYSSIEHMGLATFAFGMGGVVANFAALLHMTVHSLGKSALFFAVGEAIQKTGSQQIVEIRGLLGMSPALGWALMLGVLAILGMPPFGVFASEFLILLTAVREHPWAAPLLLLALGIAFAALFGRTQDMVLGVHPEGPMAMSVSLLPVFVHLALLLLLGLWIPPFLAEWYQLAAQLIG